jgi:hypothetical protein
MKTSLFGLYPVNPVTLFDFMPQGMVEANAGIARNDYRQGSSSGSYPVHPVHPVGSGFGL